MQADSPLFQMMEFEESVTDTEPGSDDMESCADSLPMEIDERPGGLGSYEVRFPAETPVTPPAIKPRWRNWDEDYAMGYQRHP